MIDPGAQLSLIAPSDSAYVPKNGSLQLSAKISGDQSDYSFLNVYVLNADTKDTLKRSNASVDGGINISWTNTLAPGVYNLTIIAVNPADRRVLSTGSRHVFVCIPPPVAITGFDKDETSITVNWQKTAISNFEAYEILVSRTDTTNNTPPYSQGEVIAMITDQNTTSFKDENIYFYYKYDYVVRVVTSEECGNNSAKMSIEAGTFLNLPEHTITGEAVFDKTHNKIYSVDNSDEDEAVLSVINPALMSIERTVTLNGHIVFSGLNENGSLLNVVEKKSANNFQLHTVDLSSFAVADKEMFTVPVASATVEGIFNKLVVYSYFTEATPRKNKLAVYNFSSPANSVLRETDVKEVTAIEDNSSFVLTAANDSFFVYHVNGANVQLTGDGYSPNLKHAYPHAVFASPGRIAVGGNLYDEYYNLMYSLGGDEYFIGMSADGMYAVSSENQVYDISTSNMEMVNKYGDGFGTFPLFSADNKTLYHLTEGSLNPKWNPKPRLFRYPL